MRSDGTATAVTPCNLVLDGGGVRGIALIGAIAELERRGFRPHRLLGSSAGAIVAVLYAAGYRTAELVELLATAPIDDALDVSMRSPRAAVRRGTRLVTRRGLRSGARVEDWLRDALATRGVSTFADLALDGVTDTRLGYAAHVVVSDLTAGRPRILPTEAPQLGVDPDRLDVTTALRASIAIPFVLAPVDIVDARYDDPHVLVDGGLLNTFPIDYFDHDSGGAETIGIDLHGDELDRRRDRWRPAPTTLPGLAIRMMSSLAGARNWQRDGPDAEHRVIRVPLGHVDPVDTGAETEELLAIGRDAAAMFLDQSVQDPTGADQTVADQAARDRTVEGQGVDDQAVDDQFGRDRVVADRKIEAEAIEGSTVDDRTVHDQAIHDQAIHDRTGGHEAVRDRTVESGRGEGPLR